MELRDLDGAGFDSAQIEALVENFDDPRDGRIGRVRLKDGSLRLVGMDQLLLAADQDSRDATAVWWQSRYLG
jgi:hypothetical protein